MGAQIEEMPDGFVVEGPTRLHGARLESHGDHRVAMSLAVAALLAEGQSFISGSDCTGDSFPWFEETLKTLLVPASSRS
jgi:3-phosphoshikimate 1-carboxyvinyltransferase